MNNDVPRTVVEPPRTVLDPDVEVPLIRGTISIRSPRRVLMLNPFQLPLMVSLLCVSVVFTIWPEALVHTASSFEQRGIVHHIWHYALVYGSLTTLIGMLSASTRWRLKIELVGLIVMVGALGVNLVAYIDSLPIDQLSGIDVALRVAAITGCLVRVYMVVTGAQVSLTAQQSTATLSTEQNEVAVVAESTDDDEG